MTDKTVLAPYLAEAVLAATNAIDQVPDEYRVQAYPVLLRFALESRAARAGHETGQLDTETTEHTLLSRAPNEILARIRPPSKTLEVLLLAAHIDQSDRNASVATIREAFRAARTSPPANIADVLGRLVREGSIIESDPDIPGPKQYRLSISGRDRTNDLVEASEDPA